MFVDVWACCPRARRSRFEYRAANETSSACVEQCPPGSFIAGQVSSTQQCVGASPGPCMSALAVCTPCLLTVVVVVVVVVMCVCGGGGGGGGRATWCFLDNHVAFVWLSAALRRPDPKHHCGRDCLECDATETYCMRCPALSDPPKILALDHTCVESWCAPSCSVCAYADPTRSPPHHRVPACQPNRRLAALGPPLHPSAPLRVEPGPVPCAPLLAGLQGTAASAAGFANALSPPPLTRSLCWTCADSPDGRKRMLFFPILSYKCYGQGASFSVWTPHRREQQRTSLGGVARAVHSPGFCAPASPCIFACRFWLCRCWHAVD